MATSSFLTTFTQHRAPRLMWPVAAGVSVVAHGLALVAVRTLALQTPNLPEGDMAPLPIQMVALPPDLPFPSDQAPSEVPSSSDLAEGEGSAAELPASESAPTTTDSGVPPEAPPVVPPETPAPTGPPLEPFIAPTTPQAAAPPVTSPPVAPAPQPQPVDPVPPTVAPAPPRRAAPVAPVAPVTPATPFPEASPGVEAPPPGVSPAPAPPSTAPAPQEPSGAGGQVVPVGIRLNPSGRDIPETAPQLLGATAIEVQPLASGCGFANLDALLTGMVSTSVQLQIRVEPSGEISLARPLQGTGSSAVDDLVSCVVMQRLRLQPASSAGVPQLTDAFILDANIQFF